MADPRRVVWLLGGVVALTTIPSFIAYWTHSLLVARIMFWIFIPAIYFYIGPCFGLRNNLSPCHMRSMFIAVSLLVANVFNLIVAPKMVGTLSCCFAGSRGVDAASLLMAMLILAPTDLWSAYHLYLSSKTLLAC